MADLLLELFSEEIPARMQVQAIADLHALLSAELAKAGFTAGSYESYVTPRRLALWLKNLPTELPASVTELKGPKTSAPEAALQGFLKKTGLTQDQLEQRDGTYFALVKKEGQNTASAIKAALADILPRFPWPKSMRWSRRAESWVRPLHSILCLFDGKVIPVQFAGITASNITHGHRFLSPATITIAKPEEYKEKLRAAHVIADRAERKAYILNEAEKLAASLGLQLKKDEGLLEEVTGLVEWPTVLVGTIDAKFMDLPKEVLISEMRAHQKYFALENKDGTLANKFLITANIPATDGGKAIIAGNERVLRARLADGRFFWDQDRKKSLSDWAENLKTVTYHAKLGTIAEKVERIEVLAETIADYVEKADKNLVKQAARLCKADLTTGMVGEFPELQGIMGRYYALAQNEPQPIADAIRDHYKPQGPSDSVPTEATAICLALADKLDILLTMRSMEETLPTGSKDPYAVRRAMLGFNRIIRENNINIPLKILPQKIFASATQSKFEAIKNNYITRLKIKESGKLVFDVSNDLLGFAADRLKVQMKDEGIRHDVIDAILAGGDDDLTRIVTRARAVQAFIETPEGDSLLAAFKRAQNILKDVKVTNPYTDRAIFKETAETSLCDVLDKTRDELEALLKSEDFTAAMRTLASFRAPVDSFFDTVMVNDKDDAIRTNRQNLLIALIERMKKIADFGLIQTDNKDQKKAA